MDLPRPLLDSARPRWSHRDPVEGGNPFPTATADAARWERATAAALARLRAQDLGLAKTAIVTLDPDRYRAQMLELAVARFDVWAERLLAVLDDDRSREQGRDWLDRYVANWLEYAEETLPRVSFGTELEDRLRARARYWSRCAPAESTARSTSTPL